MYKEIFTLLNYKVFDCKSNSSDYIVLIHGFGGNYKIWKYQIPILTENFTVVAIDLPSHDNNGIKLSQMMMTSIDAITKEIIAVLNEVGVKKAIFMGVSIGTIFIKQLELYYSEIVKYGILVGGVGYINAFLRLVITIMRHADDRLPSGYIYTLFSRIIMPRRCSDKSRRIFRMFSKVLNVTEFTAWLEIFLESSELNKDFIKEKHNENLYISGTSDLCFLPNIKKEAKKTEAQLIEIENCGHVCNIDQKDVFNDLLMDFLNRTFVQSI